MFDWSKIVEFVKHYHKTGLLIGFSSRPRAEYFAADIHEEVRRCIGSGGFISRRKCREFDVSY